MTRVVLDTDPGCDDALALVFALARSELDVAGVTTVHGNAPVADTTHNARAILELVDRTDVPVARGAADPFVAELDTAEHIHGEGGIRGDLPEPTSETEPVDEHAARFVVEQARKHDDLVLAAVGPLTNVALALALEPDLPELLDGLVVMGGAAFASGNVTPLAEANFHADPEAARKVVAEADPSIVGLDVTVGANLPPGWIDSLPDETPLGRSLSEWFTYYPEEALDRYDIESTPIHDLLAVVDLVEDVLEFEPYYMQVGTDSTLDRGVLVCDAPGVEGEPPNGEVALEAKYDRYRELVVETVEDAL